MKQKAFQLEVFQILEDTNYTSWFSKIDQILLSILIILDISAFILETSPQLNQNLTYQQIQADAQLLKHCLQTAQAELGNIESNQEAIASWAIFLYCQAKQETLKEF